MPNGKNDISMSITLLEVHESMGEENAGHSSPQNPITWKLEDVDAPKSKYWLLSYVTWNRHMLLVV